MTDWSVQLTYIKLDTLFEAGYPMVYQKKRNTLKSGILFTRRKEWEDLLRRPQAGSATMTPGMDKHLKQEHLVLLKYPNNIWWGMICYNMSEDKKGN